MTAPDLDREVLKRLQARVGAATVERLVELARANVSDRLSAARQAAKSKDRRALGVAFHSIRGSAQLVGARRLEEIAARCETRSRAGEIEFVAPALEELAEALASVERVLADAAAEPR